jgi:beta-lactam-binding protein with PASTA domain
VVPGGSTEFELTVTNTGDIVEQYTLVARGIPPQWVQASPRMAQVYIGEKVTFRITVSPPLAPTTAPGRMDFAIEVMSTIDNRVAERHDGFLDVQPFASVTTSLEPPDLDAKRSARTYLNVVNTGNEPEHVTATVRDTANRLRFTCRPPVIEVPPGGRARIAIDVRAARRRWTGTERRLQFNVTTASPPRDGDVRLIGSFTILPSWPRWALPAMAGGFAVVLVAATVFGMRLLQQRDAAATRTVPTLTDLDYETANQQLLAAQLDGLIVEVRTDPKPFGRILLQTPGPGTKVAARSTVNLVVSTGPDQWILSDLRAQDYVTASAELTQRGMRIQAVSQPDKTATPGTIIEQNPPAGTKLNIGDVVTLTVAKADKSATVPNIPIGTAKDEAVRLIQQAGLQASVKPPVASADFAPGQVMEISPAPGQPTTQGSIVTLTVSKGLVVPSVVGQTRDAALQQISQAGLAGRANDRCSTESPGIVLEQTPAANTAVDKTARVTLSISKACPPGG